MKLGDVAIPMIALLEDAMEAQSLAAERKDDFSRRVYIRSMFSYIEGSVWLVKQCLLKATCDASRRASSLSLDELLSDESTEIDERGKVKKRKKSVSYTHLTLPTILRV